MSTNAKKKILLVDDSPLVRAIVAHALGSAGHLVRSIDDPRGLEAALAQETPDLVLVDATYPGVTDDDLVAAASKHAGALTIVLFSDRPAVEVDGLVARIGARGSVPKDGTILAARLEPFLGTEP